MIDCHYYDSLIYWISWPHLFIGYNDFFSFILLNLCHGNFLHSRINLKEVIMWWIGFAKCLFFLNFHYISFFTELAGISVLDMEANFSWKVQYSKSVYVAPTVCQVLQAQRTSNKQNRLNPCLYHAHLSGGRDKPMNNYYKSV